MLSQSKLYYVCNLIPFGLKCVCVRTGDFGGIEDSETEMEAKEAASGVTS